MLNLFVENFVIIFVAIDPIGLLPIFATFTQGLSKSDILKLTLRSSTTAFIVLLLFWVLGSAILDFMGINIHSFRIIGGMFLVVIAFKMVFGQRQSERQNTADTAVDDETIKSIAIFPLSIPLIAGPGAITIVMLLSEKGNSSLQEQVIGFSPVAVVIALTALSLWLSRS